MQRTSKIFKQNDKIIYNYNNRAFLSSFSNRLSPETIIHTQEQFFHKSLIMAVRAQFENSNEYVFVLPLLVADDMMDWREDGYPAVQLMIFVVGLRTGNQNLWKDMRGIEESS